MNKRCCVSLPSPSGLGTNECRKVAKYMIKRVDTEYMRSRNPYYCCSKGHMQNIVTELYDCGYDQGEHYVVTDMTGNIINIPPRRLVKVE